MSPEDWEWILSTTGAIGVDSMEALVDTTATLVKLGRLAGPRAGLLVLTGGQGPAITDTFARHGLRVPPLAQASLDELAAFFDPIGGSFQNPLDAAYATETPAMLARDLDVLDRDPNVDFVAMDFFSMIMSAHRVQNDYGLGQRFRNDLPNATGERFIDAIAAHAHRASKPFFAIVSAAETEREALELREVLRDAGVLVFASAERAAVAYAKALALGEEEPRLVTWTRGSLPTTTLAASCFLDLPMPNGLHKTVFVARVADDAGVRARSGECVQDGPGHARPRRRRSPTAVRREPTSA